MELIKLKFHSLVDVITNSSTVIYTYQDGCTEPAKLLINEMLKLSGEDKTAEDIFYFGTFCDDERYLDYLDEHEDDLDEDEENVIFPKVDASYGTDEYKEQKKVREEWVNSIIKSVMIDGEPRPNWMKNAEDGGDWYNPDTYLCLIPKEEKYKVFGDKIQSLLNAINADGGRDG